jgi:hypothetical protein
MLRLWLDDERDPLIWRPGEEWMWAKTVQEALFAIEHWKFDVISFDHDLGEGPTGYDLAKVIEGMAFFNEIEPIKWEIHSANPVGRDNIRLAMESADKYWSKHHR